MDYEMLMQQALESIRDKVAINQKFIVKSLFEGCEWEKLSKGERITFGKYFANEVRENKIKNLKALERDKNNHAKYTKIY